jgi:hypothetical protein
MDRGSWWIRTNQELYQLCGENDIVKFCKLSRLRWAGHVIRQHDDDLSRRVLLSEPGGKRPRGRPRLRWEDGVEEDVARLGCRNWKIFTLNRVILITHNDAPHSVGLLWTSDQSVADNTQHSQQTNIHASGGIRNHDLSRRTAEDPCLRPRGYWDRQACRCYFILINIWWEFWIIRVTGWVFRLEPPLKTCAQYRLLAHDYTTHCS